MGPGSRPFLTALSPGARCQWFHAAAQRPIWASVFAFSMWPPCPGPADSRDAQRPIRTSDFGLQSSQLLPRLLQDLVEHFADPQEFLVRYRLLKVARSAELRGLLAIAA